MKNRLLIAICGMTGSGKTTAAKIIEEKYNFKGIKFGVTEYALEHFGETSEKLEKRLRSELREEKGMGYMADMAIPKIESYFSESLNVVIENMYSWSEYKILKQKFGGSFITIAIHASPRTRYERLISRSKHDIRKSYADPEVAKSRDYSEIEDIEKGGPIAMADYHIVNEESYELLEDELEKILSEIIK